MLCWNTNAIFLDIFLKNNIMINCITYFSNLNINYYITFLYSYPRHHKQNEIWKTLLNFKISTTRSWGIIGDFNEILHPRKKIGGTTSNSSRMIFFFPDFIDYCHLMELESFGLPYT